MVFLCPGTNRIRPLCFVRILSLEGYNEFPYLGLLIHDKNIFLPVLEAAGSSSCLRVDSEGPCPGRPHVVERELTCPSCQGHSSHLGCLHPYDLKALSPNTSTLGLGFLLRIWRTGVKYSSATVLLLHLSERDCIYLQDCFFTPVYYKLNLFSSVQCIVNHVYGWTIPK